MSIDRGFGTVEGDLLRGHPEVRLSNGRILTGASITWAISELGDSTYILRVSFTNTESAPVAVEQLLPLVSHSGFRSLPVTDLLMSETGWQSWSRAHPPRPFYANAESAPPPIRNPILPYRENDGHVAGWMTLLMDPNRKRTACLIGFLSGREQTCVVEVVPRQDGHAIRASAETEGVSVRSGATLASEPLLLAFGDAQQLLDRYTHLVAQHMHARTPQRIPSGWCSWYQFSADVTEADIRRNIDLLAGSHDRFPVDVVQIDDGYEHEVGDWLDIRDSFPSGIGSLVQIIRRRGLTPGLWLAPFLLSARSRIYTEHPDWVVRDEVTGDPLVAIENWGCDNYPLDTTHPAVLAWLDQVIRTVCLDWGVEYLKLDFLYAAALRGRRFDPNVTGAQAYSRGLQLIRRVAGDRFLLGCGAPLVSSVGLVDGMRIGSDVAGYWKPPSDTGVGPAMFNAIRATLNRSGLHRRWWLNDPDCVLVRADTELSEIEVRAWASVVAMSGGMLLIGDDLSQVDPARLALLARLFPPCGQSVESLPPLVDDAPERIRLRIHRGWADWAIVGLANWSDTVRDEVFDPSHFDLPSSAEYHLVDLWSGAHAGPLQGATPVGTLVPHELRLLSVHPASTRPSVVGSTGHLLGEAMDVRDERWNGTTLHLMMAPGRADGRLLVAMPDGWLHTPMPSDPTGLRYVDGLVEIPCDPRQATEFNLSFTDERNS